MIVLKYYASELNNSLVTATHDETFFTRHMRCKLYNEKNVHVGTLTTLNHHFKQNDMHFVTATSTIRLFKYGRFIYQLIFNSDHGYLKKMVRTIPHYTDGKFFGKKLVVNVGPPKNTSSNLDAPRLLVIHVTD